MTNYEQLTASPDTLGAFLASSPLRTAPGTKPSKGVLRRMPERGL